MGRTLISYRRLLEEERNQWRLFGKVLSNDDYESFTELWNYAFQLADAASLNTRPILMENIFMTMLIRQQRQILRLKKIIAKHKREINQLKKELRKSEQ